MRTALLSLFFSMSIAFAADNADVFIAEIDRLKAEVEAKDKEISALQEAVKALKKEKSELLAKAKEAPTSQAAADEERKEEPQANATDNGNPVKMDEIVKQGMELWKKSRAYRQQKYTTKRPPTLAEEENLQQAIDEFSKRFVGKTVLFSGELAASAQREVNGFLTAPIHVKAYGGLREKSVLIYDWPTIFLRTSDEGLANKAVGDSWSGKGRLTGIVCGDHGLRSNGLSFSVSSE